MNEVEALDLVILLVSFLGWLSQVTPSKVKLRWLSDLQIQGHLELPGKSDLSDVYLVSYTFPN